MDENKWFEAATPQGGLEYLCSDGHSSKTGLSLNRFKAGRRKLRLFMCACVRRIWELVPEGPCRAAVELGERLSAGEDVAELAAALRDAPGDAPPGENSVPLSRRHAAAAARACVETNVRYSSAVATQSAARAVGWARLEAADTQDHRLYEQGQAEEARGQLPLLWDVFGNPFRPVPVERRWLTRTVVSVARGIDEEQDYASLPILADALEEADCEQSEILDHCRGEGPHVRGCWVVDLLLGKGLPLNRGG